TPTPRPTPIQGHTLHLDPALFAADAVILDQPVSRSVRYGAPGTPTIELSWEGFPQLGIWSREGGDFLCIEPWFGMASPVDWDGPFVEKPGLMLIPPGDQRSCSLRIRLC
ncbi:MAG: aldose 1-epimerase family protein, partial [Rhodospirillales bacterium]|nr:aldose 1-epimerase family protein [Rhodospirillales bacterium]